MANREDISSQRKKYYVENKERICAYRRAYYQENKNKINAWHNNRNALLKTKILSYYSIANYPVCAHCGITDIDLLTIDHINNDGKQHREVVGEGSHLYNWLRRNDYPDGFQVLCFNCNRKKETLRRRNEKNLNK